MYSFNNSTVTSIIYLAIFKGVSFSRFVMYTCMSDSGFLNVGGKTCLNVYLESKSNFSHGMYVG